MKLKPMNAAVGLAFTAMLANVNAVAAPSQTAQSVMVSTTYNSNSYEIRPEITYSFNRGTHREPGTAMGYYTNTLISGPVVSCTNGGKNDANCAAGNQPTTPTAPDPYADTPQKGTLKLQQQAQRDNCTFFSGGTLTGTTFEQSVPVPGTNGNGNWKFTWTYEIAPNADYDVDPATPGVQVAAFTAWTSTQSGSLTVDVGFSGFVSSESYLKQNSTTKYSFTMIDSGVTRARNVNATLESSFDNSTWTPLATMNLNNLDTDGDLINDALAVSPTITDYEYYGNGGVFGNSAVYSSLHAGTGSPMLVNAILTSDTFANNNNDLANGNVHQANYGGTWLGVPGDPNGAALLYRTVITGTIKGNNGSGSQSFSVGSNPIVTNACH